MNTLNVLNGTGAIHRCERHGKRWFDMGGFCIHDAEGELPPADVSLAQRVSYRRRMCRWRRCSC